MGQLQDWMFEEPIWKTHEAQALPSKLPDLIWLAIALSTIPICTAIETSVRTLRQFRAMD
jgi:hypothetical protein